MSDDDSAAPEKEDIEPVPPVDVLDPVAVKRTIDDSLYSLVGLAGYQQDLRLSNAKLAIMTAACAVACYAQLGPHTFPENKAILAGCVGFYTLSCTVLQLLATFVEKQYVVRTYAKEGGGGAPLIISSDLPRGSNDITVTVEFRDAALTASESFTRSVGTYFSAEGEIDELALQRDLQGAIFKMEDHFNSAESKKSK